MVEKLRVLFERLVAELPSDTGRLNICRVPKGDGTVIELLPANRDSASFGAHADDNGNDYLDFSFGRMGSWTSPSDFCSYTRHKRTTGALWTNRFRS